MPTPSHTGSHHHPSSTPQSPARPSPHHHGFASCPDDAPAYTADGDSWRARTAGAVAAASYDIGADDDDDGHLDGLPSTTLTSAGETPASATIDGSLPSPASSSSLPTDNNTLDGPKPMDVDEATPPVDNGSPSAASTTTMVDERTARRSGSAVSDDRKSTSRHEGRRSRGAGSLSPVSGVGEGDGSRPDVGGADWDQAGGQGLHSAGHEYSNLRVSLPCIPGW